MPFASSRIQCRPSSFRFHVSGPRRPPIPDYLARSSISSARRSSCFFTGQWSPPCNSIGVWTPVHRNGPSPETSSCPCSSTETPSCPATFKWCLNLPLDALRPHPAVVGPVCLFPLRVRRLLASKSVLRAKMCRHHRGRCLLRRSTLAKRLARRSDFPYHLLHPRVQQRASPSSVVHKTRFCSPVHTICRAGVADGVVSSSGQLTRQPLDDGVSKGEERGTVVAADVFDPLESIAPPTDCKNIRMNPNLQRNVLSGNTIESKFAEVTGLPPTAAHIINIKKIYRRPTEKSIFL